MPSLKYRIQKAFHFCPRCGGRLGYKRLHGKNELVCKSCGNIFWMNSKPTASVFIVQRGKILLTKRAIAPYLGYWDAPGGYLDVHEDPVKGLQREMREELRIHILRPKLLGLYLGLYPGVPLQSTFNSYYVATQFTGTLEPHDDVAAFGWHSLAKLPKNIAFANNRQALRDLKKFLGR